MIFGEEHQSKKDQNISICHMAEYAHKGSSINNRIIKKDGYVIFRIKYSKDTRFSMSLCEYIEEGVSERDLNKKLTWRTKNDE